MTLTAYVSELFGCPEEMLFTRTRKREVVNARQVCMSVMREFTPSSLSVIGKYFYRDHVTVMYACIVVKNLYISDKAFRCNVDSVYDACRDGFVSIPYSLSGYDVPVFMTEEELLINQLT